MTLKLPRSMVSADSMTPKSWARATPPRTKSRNRAGTELRKRINLHLLLSPLRFEAALSLPPCLLLDIRRRPVFTLQQHPRRIVYLLVFLLPVFFHPEAASMGQIELQTLPGADVFPAELRQKLAAALEAKGPGYKPRTEHLLPDGRPQFTNRLILEDSPYLLQHAHNPVNWYSWGAEAFDSARRLNRPIFLSIGYSTCHWCHVMEVESFESVEIAKLMNERFVCIKVDREQRPDVDDVYMNA